MSTLAKREVFSLTPATLAEAMEYSKIIANSDICPKDFKGKPENVLVAVQMGAEVGLPPIQSIQNIAVINGRPSIWGDASLALVMASPLCEDVIEVLSDDKTEYSCTVIRKGHKPHTKSYSVEDAKRAGLWGRQGPWTTNPTRMLQMRARGFALRDKFPDVLKGLILAEEAMDMPEEKHMGTAQVVAEAAPLTRTEGLKVRLSAPTQAPVEVEAEAPPPVDINILMTAITDSASLDDLNEVVELARKLPEEEKKQVRDAYSKRKKELDDVQT